MTARSLGFTFLALAFSSGAAFADWTTDPATIKATTNNIPKVSAVNDGGTGTFVVWQEESAPGSGVLRAQHVLSTGGVDPAWPADGALLCGTAADRAAIGVIADHLGGAYVWWKEGTSIYLSRFDATGAIASGWPARGRLLGMTYTATLPPAAIEDGAHGIYLAWNATSGDALDPTWIQGTHLGPANTTVGGWPAFPRTLAAVEPVATLDYWPHLALASDGGIFLGWTEWSLDETQVPSTYRLRRFTTSGIPALGWDAPVDVAPFDATLLNDENPETSLMDLTPDGSGGVLYLIGLLSGTAGYASVDVRLLRVASGGTTPAGWPAAGVSVRPDYAYADGGTEASVRVLRDALGGIQVGTIDYATDGGSSYHVDASGATPPWSPIAAAHGFSFQGSHIVPNGNGGVFLATFKPTGPWSQWEPYAFLHVTQSRPPAGWQDFFEVYTDHTYQFYGDIGLASSGIDGGAVFYWSQVRDRFGLFARRFEGAAEITGISPPIRVRALDIASLHFVAGEGVRASVSVPDGESAVLDLFDVSGRRLASAAVASTDSGRPLVIAGTRALASGLYFARLANDRASASGKVVVAR